MARSERSHLARSERSHLARSDRSELPKSEDFTLYNPATRRWAIWPPETCFRKLSEILPHNGGPIFSDFLSMSITDLLQKV